MASGVTVAAVEVSSHALALHRVDGTRFRIAAFTNLSQDHLDFHDTMESYFAAKARLFEPDLADRAVVCIDDAHGRLLRDAAQVPTVGYSIDDASDLVLGPDGNRRSVGAGADVRIGLAGRFNVANAIGAATIAAELGVGLDAIARRAGRGRVGAGPFRAGRRRPALRGGGRLRPHPRRPGEGAEAAARGTDRPGRVIVVFGSGGDRDRTKRPLMGEAAAAGADVIIVTSDNPRSEAPHAIIDAVLEGIPADVHPIVEPDRRAAIAAGIAAARPGDVLVIAGKGHETTQTIGDQVIPFDDRVVVHEELAR